MVLPADLFETWELFSQVPRGMPFQKIGNHRRAKPWRRTHKDMDMIYVRFHSQ